MADETGVGLDESYTALILDPKLFLIVSVSSVGIFGVQAVSPALPSIASTLDVPDAQIGLVISAYFFPAMLMVPFTGAFADIYGRRLPLLAGLTLFGISGFLISFVNDFQLLLLLRVFQGFGAAGIGSIAVTMIGDLYSGPAGTAAQGVRMSGHGIVQIVIPAVAGFLAGVRWNLPFLLYGLALPLAVLVALFLPETAEDTQQTKSLIDEVRSYLRTIRAEATDTDFGVLLVGGFTANFFRTALLTFGPLYAVQQLGASVFVAGTLLSLRGIVRTVSSPFSGIAVEYLSHKRALIIVIGVIAASVTMISVSTTVVVLAVGFAFFSLGEAFYLPILVDMVTIRATDESRGGFVSLLTETRLAGSVIGPVVLGMILSMAGYRIMFLVVVTFLIGFGVLAHAFLEGEEFVLG